jgi:hypothetical protein
MVSPPFCLEFDFVRVNGDGGKIFPPFDEELISGSP